MKYIYPMLELEIYKKGIKLKRIADCLEISPKAFSNKLKGITAFTWPEACAIQKNFFPYISKDELFALSMEKNTQSQQTA